ncbi:MAG: serine hydrolase [Planctomycetes bacterium]|nr:serine hydrolase [Planctomycetota bacterium]
MGIPDGFTRIVAMAAAAMAFFLAGGGAVMAGEFVWETAKPEEVGMDGAKLIKTKDELAARGTKTFLVIRNDKIAYEWYEEGRGPEERHYTASLAKALVGGMSLGLAIDDELISAYDLASKYIPAWKDDPLKSKITIRHLATHTSGLEDANEEGVEHKDLPGWKGAFWRREPDPFSIAINEAPVIFEPGTKYHYSNTGMAALAYAVTAAIKETPHPDVRTMLKERIMDPIGVPPEEWSVGYGETYEVDGLKLVANWGGGSFTPRAVARIGRLMLRGGDWEGEQLLSEKAVKALLTYDGTKLPPKPEGNPQPASGLCWYTNYDRTWPEVPWDAFAGAGAKNQMLLVVPSLDLIVVRNGSRNLGQESLREGFWGGAEEYLFNPLMEAVTDPPEEAAPDCPRSRAITGVEFAPVSQIVRRGIDSDNWPITWADDDAQYVAYGDGWGFEPRIKEKLSLGYGKVTGGPEDPTCENIRSQTGEITGDGRKGAKAAGLVMVDGVLYMMVRNVDNSQLAWSADLGKTWEWGFKFKTSFGCPTILNFGKNYEGARDSYVYVYSNDGPSAYEAYDGMVLARVHKDKIRERDAWEFFVRLDEDEAPVWSKQIDERGPVLSYEGHCRRSDVVYNPGLGLYIMALGHDNRGGWGIYEAPEPWGPWNLIWRTDYWGLGGTHYYRFPPKWISKDGRMLHMIFSGRTLDNVSYDALCVRKVRLQVAE